MTDKRSEFRQKLKEKSAQLDAIISDLDDIIGEIHERQAEIGCHWADPTPEYEGLEDMVIRSYPAQHWIARASEILSSDCPLTNYYST